MTLPTLASFLEGTRRNAYIQFPGFASLYVRHTVRFGIDTIDLANIEALKPGNGAFTRLVQHLRQAFPTLGIYVECVMSKRFEVKLAAMGFARRDAGLSPCFFLSPDMELK
jgi:hypothetical protein